MVRKPEAHGAWWPLVHGATTWARLLSLSSDSSGVTGALCAHQPRSEASFRTSPSHAVLPFTFHHHFTRD